MSTQVKEISAPNFPSVLASQNKKIIRPMVYLDIPNILDIDKNCFIPPLTEEQVKGIVAAKDFVVKVLEVNKTVVGYSMYKLRSHDIFICRIGIDLAHRNNGYGAFLLKNIYRNMNVDRNKLICHISEQADGIIKWLRKMGFFATCVRRGESYDGSDAYSFRLILPESIIKQQQKEEGVI